MNRREVLVNLLLLTVIGCLAYLIFTAGDEEEAMELPKVAMSTSSSKTETGYNPELAQRAYPRFGQVAIMKAIIPPTPTPPPPTPAPTPTPDIDKAIMQWKLLSVFENTAMIENRAEHDPEKQFFNMKPGEVKEIPVERGEMKKLTLVKVDESMDNGGPTATFVLEGVKDKPKTLKANDDPGAGAPPPPPGAPQ